MGRSRYRKTDRRRHSPLTVERRRCNGELPNWYMFFILPVDLGFSLADGPYPNFVGVSLKANCVTVTGKNRQWVIEQTAAFLCDIVQSRSRSPLVITGRLSKRLIEEIPRRNEEEAIEIVAAAGDPVVVISGRFFSAIVKAG
jgi:hypothetical protein